ncbi:response regulator [Candidatus Pacearchaeota archaeon]|nr:response regulator [Candidatus Pacearchaeota archaeon]
MVKKILVVDDIKEDLDTIKSILEKEGYEVVAVDNGADALDNLTSNGIGLLLIDIKMPTLSGYDLLRLAREKVNNNVPMIYITIVPQKEVDMDNIDGFIQKPFTLNTLISEVKKHI